MGLIKTDKAETAFSIVLAPPGARPDIFGIAGL